MESKYSRPAGAAQDASAKYRFHKLSLSLLKCGKLDRLTGFTMTATDRNGSA
jgi:hypothetical protein